ncbi:MAG: ATP-grasp domain-containing protein [Oligoflexales bacterium]
MHFPFDIFQLFYLLGLSFFNIGTAGLAEQEIHLTAAQPHVALDHISFQYFQNDYLSKLLQDNKTLVLVGAGWSESSLPKMYRVSQRQHQNRAFAPHYLLALRYIQMGGNAKVFYLTTCPIRKDYRRFLFQLMTGSTSEDSFSKFENESFKILELKPPSNYDKDEPFSFLELKNNKKKIENLFHEMQNLKKNDNNHFLGFALHAGGPLSQEWAEKMGIEMLANPLSLAKFGLKSVSRQSYRDCNIPHPLGTYEPVFSSSDLALAVRKLMDLGKRKFMIKIDRSALGDGNLNLEFCDCKISRSQIAEKFNKLASESYKKRMEEHGVIIEEYIEGDSFSSPSVSSFIEENGPRPYSLSEQVLGGNNGLKYTGGRGKLTKPDENIAPVKYGKTVAEHLYYSGVKGPVGTDFVGIKKGKENLFYAVENNIRSTATLYPYQISYSLLEGEFDGRYYHTNTHIEVKNMKSLTNRNKFSKWLYEWLPSQKLVYSKGNRKGLVVINDNIRIGLLTVLAIGETLEECNLMLQEFESAVREYSPVN